MNKCLGLIVLVCLSLVLKAEVKMPYVFSSHMVLQRQAPIPVWGWAHAGSEIKVTFGSAEVKTKVGANGKWKVFLPEFEAGGPYTLKVFEANAEKPAIEYTDVLIGDVWLASGQSNMELKVREADGADEEISKALNENIRLFNVPHNISLSPLENTLESYWQICDSNSVKDASAVAYYFAKNIQKELGVPVGILQSTWGGTPCEAWTSREALLSEPISKVKVLDHDSITYEHLVKDTNNLEVFWDIVYNPKKGSDSIYNLSDFKDKNWQEVSVPGVIKEWEPEAYEGMIWLRKAVKLSSDFKNSRVSVNLGHPEMNYSLYFNGVEICKNQWNANLSHSYNIPDSIIEKGENVITLRMAALWGGGGLNAPAEDIFISNGDKKISLAGSWKYKKDLEPGIPKIYYYQQFHCYLFNGMIKPVIPYALKGFIWYQGENNEDQAYAYRKLFPLMINDWRIRWQQGYLPFLYVQLPNYMKQDEAPTDGRWAVLRESQYETLNVPNTALTCIIDLGETENIHPTNKTDVGNRLADVAKEKVYGLPVISSGPVFNKLTINGSTIRVEFSHIADGISIADGTELKGFAIAGSDKKYYWAKANIEGNKVVLSSEMVSEPIAVRYAWANNPECNLVNSIGLPAVPFRTDDWQVITQE